MDRIIDFTGCHPGLWAQQGRAGTVLFCSVRERLSLYNRASPSNLRIFRRALGGALGCHGLRYSFNAGKYRNTEKIDTIRPSQS